MRKLLVIAALSLLALPAYATDVTHADKSTGDTLTATEQNQIKTAVNSKYDSGDDVTLGAVSAGAGGFTVDADGDVEAKSISSTRTSGSPSSYYIYEDPDNGDNKITLTGPTTLSADEDMDMAQVPELDEAETISAAWDLGTPSALVLTNASGFPTLNQSTTGNAATATTLETARTIGGVSFNGAANINLPGVNASGTQDTTGNAATATNLESETKATVLAEPDQLQPISDAWLVAYFPAETYSSGVTIDAIHITTSATCTDALNFEEWTQSGTTASSTVEAITLSGTFTEDDGTLADGSVAADGRLMVDLPATPTDIAFYEITVIFHAN